MLLNVLIDYLPENEFLITDNPQPDSTETDYQRILKEAVENLS